MNLSLLIFLLISLLKLVRADDADCSIDTTHLSGNEPLFLDRKSPTELTFHIPYRGLITIYHNQKFWVSCNNRKFVKLNEKLQFS